MIKLGEIQTLTIVKEVEFGVYLADCQNSPEADTVVSEEKASPSAGQKQQPDPVDSKVLLPAKQKPSGAALGDPVEVFIYRDSSDRLIATTNTPALTLGRTARLKVAETGKIGAFLDWGLEKELLLPFREQTRKVQAGETCIAALYIDKSSRLCATMKIYHYLDTASPYKRDDQVTGEIYEISGNFGAFVAVDDRYSGLIPPQEIYGSLKVGDTVSARVTAVKEDGKLDLSLRQKAYLQIETDAAIVLKTIDSYQGVLPFNDKASPETIRKELQMSKNEFKRAVGHLLKADKITITADSIKTIV